MALPEKWVSRDLAGSLGRLTPKPPKCCAPGVCSWIVEYGRLRSPDEPRPPNSRFARHPGESRSEPPEDGCTRYSDANGGGINESELARRPLTMMWRLGPATCSASAGVDPSGQSNAAACRSSRRPSNAARHDSLPVLPPY